MARGPTDVLEIVVLAAGPHAFLRADAARIYARFSRPRKTSLNWFIPAFVKSSVGSSCGTSGELGTTRWPFRSKNFRKEARISFDVIRLIEP